MKTGIVVLSESNICAVRTPSGITVLDVRGHSLNPGDEITGDLHKNGAVSLHNVTRGEDFNARTEAFSYSEEDARELIAESLAD